MLNTIITSDVHGRNLFDSENTVDVAGHETSANVI